MTTDNTTPGHDTNQLDLAAIRARAEAATPGPWGHDSTHEQTGELVSHNVITWPYDLATAHAAYIEPGAERDQQAHLDAEHIAGMDPSTTLALVAEVERLRERLDLITCHICEELMIPSEDVRPTKDSWAHEGCMTEGP